ncbi:ribbon-helix-helix protein, CopG family [Xanthobacter sp. VTT E-85241]|uniref:ribbon-helix-helix protein, CopG family n=1 Tax=Roseixanthobacter finlandensis TaxID=3119922 RepID=UPI00372AF60D
MGKTPSLGVRVQPETKAALEKAAKEDVRSVSSLIEKILTDWLRERGYLPK